MAHGFSFDTDEAEDVAQDAMLKLWELHETTDGREAAEALTVSITRHLCIDRMRRRRTIPMDSRPVIDDRHAPPDIALETPTTNAGSNNASKPSQATSTPCCI